MGINRFHQATQLDGISVYPQTDTGGLCLQAGTGKNAWHISSVYNYN
ncbi:MAG TPA: hypothetical protein GXX75_07230 [Clostridiales bacterium]|nr:hypothetical protein [Clostridiales bacterium]